LLTIDRSAISHAWDGVLSRVVQRNELVDSLEALREVFGSEADYLEAQHFNKLHRVVIGIDQGDLEAIIREGDFDIDAVDVMGRTPLYWAAARGDSEKASLLLKYGASPNAGLSVITGVIHHLELTQGPFGLTHNSKFEVVKLLVEAGVNINIRETDGYTPLHAAARHAEGHHILRLLLDRGLDPSVHNLYGQTPLHDAVGQNHHQCAEILIRYGADINKTWGPSRPPIFDAIDRHSHDCIELLLRAGADLKFVDVQGGELNILHWLATHADRNTWALFMQANLAGLDFEDRTKDDETPLQLLIRQHPDAEEDLVALFKSLLSSTLRENTTEFEAFFLRGDSSSFPP
jgi:ankyrin repeat protein